VPRRLIKRVSCPSSRMDRPSGRVRQHQKAPFGHTILPRFQTHKVPGMAASSVILPDSTRVDLDSPYGFETPLEQPGRFKATLVLSPINQRIQVLNYQVDDAVGPVERSEE